MSTKASVTRAKFEHVLPVADNMREADAREVFLSSKKSPHEAMAAGFQESVYAWTILLDREPIAMFGLSCLTILGNTGVPWLLGTDKMLAIRRQFIAESVEHVDFMNIVYPHLVNFVHVGNTASIRWLKSLGFTLHEAVPAGPFGALFRKFERFAHV